MTPVLLTSTEAATTPVVPTSVVVVSHGRPDHLHRAVQSILQQDHPDLELIVVADEPGLTALEALPFRAHIKTELQDVPNISAARNIGIELAGGVVVAFLDDDAVAEPTWARRLSAPFTNPQVLAATGFTKGRNGLSWQWTAAQVDRDGVDTPLEVPEDSVTLLPVPANGAIKTVGTNAAFRRTALARVNGFDERFRYFLDETDLNLRMAKLGGLTAVVPQAQVLHAFAVNGTRRADRAPTDLHEIGASVGVFALMHAPTRTDQVIAQFRAVQRRRALTHVVRGALEPRDVRRLLAGFDEGVREGMARPATHVDVSGTAHFQPLPPESKLKGHKVIPFRPWRTSRATQLAQRESAAGFGVTLLKLAPTARPHRVFFDQSGIWVQRGGLFGRSIRVGRRVRWATFRLRSQAEIGHIAKNRSPLPC